MKSKPRNNLVRCTLISYLVMLSITIGLLFSSPAKSFQFEYGATCGNLDTTLSYGTSWRVQGRDSKIIGYANGGDAFSMNGDDGNLNYDKGLISNVVKITGELDLSRRNIGVFVRGSAFYDFENEDGSREKAPLTNDALELVGSDVDLLDAYLWVDFDLVDMPAQIRIGEQVVSWGESTFIQNSINMINSVDVNAIRLPGAELREALIPEGLMWGSLGITENTTLEAFYLYDYGETVIDPSGSYFSTNDFAGEGGNRVQLGWGDVPEGSFLAVPRYKTDFADDSGQYGTAFRIFVPGLNDTELGLYYINYHNRLPIISAHTGSLTGLVNAGVIGGAAPGIIAATINGGSIDAGVAAGVAAGTAAEAATAIATGAFTAEEAAGGPGPGMAAGLAAGAETATQVATDAYVKTARYYTEYPEDIHLFGVSFNTDLGSTGIALQGEVSHRRDMPLQVDDIELIYAALGLLNAEIAAENQIGDYSGRFETTIPGFILRNVTQFQTTGTKMFGPTLGADQVILLGEVGVTHVHSMPSKDKLRLEGPGTYVSGNSTLGPVTHTGKPTESSRHFADATSYGYRLVCRLDFNNAIGAINVSPRIAWRHDVNGISPGPGGNFLENRKAITFGVGATYQNSWSADLSYTNFFGAGRYNLVNDRDFMTLNVKYSF